MRNVFFLNCRAIYDGILKARRVHFNEEKFKSDAFRASFNALSEPSRPPKAGLFIKADAECVI
jgi:hypothetical protein